MAKHNIKYKSLPALKICRMGVRTGLTERGLGKKMIAFAVRQALKIHEKAACRFITLDSKNDESLPKAETIKMNITIYQLLLYYYCRFDHYTIIR